MVGKWRVGLALAAAAWVQACGAPADLEPEEDVESQSESVERANADKHYVVATPALAANVYRAARATGAIFVPRKNALGENVVASDGTPIRSTCGVTFVDRTHAITAAHCADDIDVKEPANVPLRVELYDVGANVDWTRATTLTGKFPAWTHPKIEDPGYRVTALSCKIVRRCKFGDYACPAAIKAKQPDIALLECPAGLPRDREPVTIATADPERSGNVSVFWFHEIYDTPTAQPPRSQPGALDLFAHYTQSDPTGMGNFHYFGADRNQLLPLVSLPFTTTRGTVPRRRVGRTGTTVWTDLFGCHGTSGSGVMQVDPATGRYELLGPVATASGDWGGARLCTDLATHRAGRASLSYTALEYVRGIL